MKSPESWLKFEPSVVLTRNSSLNANSMPILLAAGSEENWVVLQLQTSLNLWCLSHRCDSEISKSKMKCRKINGLACSVCPIFCLALEAIAFVIGRIAKEIGFSAT
ncbi:hypothetical protein [Variovorax sp. LT1R16]|uniref:hypothetical protein n=1 Tax=Variovorax sp. LT1R16 TaxID=3443728 RepID=UPI003F46AEDB